MEKLEIRPYRYEVIQTSDVLCVWKRTLKGNAIRRGRNQGEKGMCAGDSFDQSVWFQRERKKHKMLAKLFEEVIKHRQEEEFI